MRNGPQEEENWETATVQGIGWRGGQGKQDGDAHPTVKCMRVKPLENRASSRRRQWKAVKQRHKKEKLYNIYSEISPNIRKYRQIDPESAQEHGPQQRIFKGLWEVWIFSDWYLGRQESGSWGYTLWRRTITFCWERFEWTYSIYEVLWTMNRLKHMYVGGFENMMLILCSGISKNKVQ